MKKNLNTIKQLNNILDISVKKRNVEIDFPLHWHDFFEIEIITEGSGIQILNGREYEIKKGCAYLLSPSDFHEIKTDGLSVLNIGFREKMLSDTFLNMAMSQKLSGVFYFSDAEFDEIKSMYDVIEAEYENNRKYKNEFLKSMLECFIIMFLRKAKNVSDIKEDCYIQKAILYLQLHFKENPSLGETAKAVGFNTNYFSKKFKEYTKKNYSEYLTQMRLDYAKKLLLSSRLSVTEICFASGFASLSNFMRVFKENEGVTPKRYKRKINE